MDEYCPFIVYGHGANLATAGFGDADVEVAEFGLTDAAAVFDLLSHLILYVSAAGLRLILVDRVQDGFDQVGLGVFAHVDDRGDDAGAYLLQVSLDDPCINGVPEHPVEVIDDDVVDVLLGFDPGDHLLEGRPLIDARGCTAGFYKFINNIGAQALSFALSGFALCGNRDTFGIIVGADLAGC